MTDELRPDLVEAAGGVENVPRYLRMEAEQIAEEFEFANDCGYPFAAHMHPTESGKGKTWACPAVLDVERLARALCATRDPVVSPADVFVDDECRARAREIIDAYADRP